MYESRIPHLDGTSKKAVASWLSALHGRGMLFCLDENPKDIVLISDGSRMFSDEEAVQISSTIDKLFLKFGDELHDLAYDTISKTFHTPSERRAIKSMHG